MSDNPADSLRRELRDALAADCQSVPCIDKVHWADADRVLPIVEAARADERERLQQENQQLRDEIAAARKDKEVGGQ